MTAHINLGLAYSNGRGVEKDYSEAMRSFRKAVARAQSNHSTTYSREVVVEEKYAEMEKVLRKSVKQELARAQFCIAAMYYFGKGVEKDYVEAYAWFNLASANDYGEAAKLRDTMETRMSPQQITTAQERTKELKKLIAEKQAAAKSER